MNQLFERGNLRDYWGRWAPAASHNLAWLNAVDCFRPKVYASPNISNVDIAASGYSILVLPMIPGTWIIGLSAVNADSLDFQLTDTATNYRFCSAPCSCSLLAANGGFTPPFWMPEPYLMAGAAQLRVELWNNTAAATDNSQLLIHVLEPREV